MASQIKLPGANGDPPVWIDPQQVSYITLGGGDKQCVVVMFAGQEVTVGLSIPEVAARLNALGRDFAPL